MVEDSLLQPFVRAVRNVIGTMAFTELQVGKLEEKHTPVACGVVSGVCGLVGKDATGSFALTFEQDALLRIASKMLYTELTELTGEVVDVVGEIANMVSGGARRELDEQGLSIDMSLPVLITGEGHQISHRGDGPFTHVPFQCDAGFVYLEIFLKRLR